MKKQYFKITAIVSLAILIIIMAIATFVEKENGTAFVSEHIYESWWFVTLWFITAISSLIYIIKQGIFKKPSIFLIHASFYLILLGAFLTFTTSIQGKIHLQKNKIENSFNSKKENSQQKLPFSIVLTNFEIAYYTGTQAPSDYISLIKIIDQNQEIEGKVSMNNIFEYRGYRFYQSSFDQNMQGATLLVKSDPYGLLVTYLGYSLLFLSIIIYFFTSNTAFRALLNHPILKSSVLTILLLCGGFSLSFAETKTIPKENAKQLGELQILYQERICPLQSFAKDFTLKLYGKSSYKSMSCEQVLAGWMFYPSHWKNEAMIKVKNKNVQNILGIDGKYAAFSDFFVNGKTYKLGEYLQKIHWGDEIEGAKDIIAADEKIQLLFMLQTENLFKLFPYKNLEKNLIWYAPTDKLSDSINESEQLLIYGGVSLMKEFAQDEDFTSLAKIITKIDEFQQKNAKSLLLTPQKVKAERIYNSFNVAKPIAMINMFFGLLALIYFFQKENRNNRLINRGKAVSVIFNCILLLNGLIILSLVALRGYISGRLPLGNGFETMQFLAICIIILAFLFRKRMFLSIAFGFLFSGLVLLVSTLSAANPQITQLQPVLISPLLSVHVSLIMISYTLLAFITFIAIGSFITMFLTKNSKIEMLNTQLLQLSVFSRILLYPAVFLLASGIFVGAIWAEVSWGTYWSWDPKETWALITMLIYSFPLHQQKLTSLKKLVFFNIYLLLAFLSVLMTYFGVNYILGGMHSYGGSIGLNTLMIVLLLSVFFILLPLFAYFKYRKISKVIQK